MTDHVLVEKSGDHVLVITLNRPEARNAVSIEMAQKIAETVQAADQDPDVRVGILTSSSDGVFCSGADLKVLAAGRTRELSFGEHGFSGFMRGDWRIPWIAAVSGVTLGGGMEFALACDMVVATETTTFGVPEVKRGGFAAAGGVFRLPRVIPRSIAIEMAVTGEPISAQRAYELGLVNHLTAPGKALGKALEIAAQIARAAPMAVRESLALARVAQEHTEDELWALSKEAGKRIGRSRDFIEGAKAFAEKRPPVWTGN
jgi:enoyl-CoA hydratase/carnithine racemase